MLQKHTFRKMLWGGVIFNMLSLSTLAQVPATLSDVWVDQVTTTNMGVPDHKLDDVVVNCDMIKTLHDQPIIGIAWDEGCQSNVSHAFFKDYSGHTYTINIDGSRPDIVIGDNPDQPGRYRAAITYYDAGNFVRLDFYDLIDVGLPTFNVASAGITLPPLSFSAYPPFSDTDPMPHLDMWTDTRQYNKDGFHRLDELIVTWTELDPIGTSDIYYALYNMSGFKLQGRTNLSAQVASHTGHSESSDVACYTLINNPSNPQKFAVFTYTVATPGAPPSILTAVRLLIPPFGTPTIVDTINHSVASVLFPRIESLSIQYVPEPLWQVAVSARVGSGYQGYGLSGQSSNTLQHFTTPFLLNDVKSPCVAGGLEFPHPITSPIIGKKQFTVGYLVYDSLSYYAWDIAPNSGLPLSGSYYQINQSPTGAISPDYTSADASKSLALSTCSNSGDYLLSAWYDGRDIGNGSGGNIFMKLSPSPDTMKFRPTVVQVATVPAATLYPNPANDWLHLTTSAPAPCHYTIMDMTGRVMLQGSTPSKAIDIRSLSSGTYLLQCGNETHRFVK